MTASERTTVTYPKYVGGPYDRKKVMLTPKEQYAIQVASMLRNWHISLEKPDPMGPTYKTTIYTRRRIGMEGSDTELWVWADSRLPDVEVARRVWDKLLKQAKCYVV